MGERYHSTKRKDLTEPSQNTLCFKSAVPGNYMTDCYAHREMIIGKYSRYTVYPQCNKVGLAPQKNDNKMKPVVFVSRQFVLYPYSRYVGDLTYKDS